MTNMKDLLGYLPVCEKRFTLPEGEKVIRYVDEENPCFVQPELREKEELLAGETRIVVISSPAAMGKSTLAEFLALKTRAPLCDLAEPEFQAGTATFHGYVGKTWGARKTERIMEYLEKGKFLFILDALDEAELKAGPANFNAFVDDLCDLAQGTMVEPKLLLLTRSYTAETLLPRFIKEGIHYAHYEIEFFGEAGAIEFVGKYYDHKHEKRRPPRFNEARELLFDRVVESLGVGKKNKWDNRQVRNFLGYAPVLVAISEYLADPDYGKMIKELKKLKPTDPWKFLVQIIQDLLLRDQRKFIKAAKSDFGTMANNLNWSGWDYLYTPAEQILHVVNYKFGVEGTVSTSIRLPEEIRVRYEDKVSFSIPQHVFMKRTKDIVNVVFEEYMFAAILSKNSYEFAKPIRNYMKSPDYLPKPLFGRFMVALTKTDEEGKYKIGYEDLGFLYESLLSAQTTEPHSVNINVETDGDLILTNITLTNNGLEELRLISDNIGDRIEFHRRLSDATIIVDNPVEVGKPNISFIIGPNVTIECPTFFCSAPEVVVRIPEEEEESVVIIIADEYSTVSVPRKIDVKGDASRFGIRWPASFWPWSKYKLEKESRDEVTDEEIIETHTYFRWIFRQFKKDGYPALGQYKNVINDGLDKRPEKALKLLAFLLKKGIIFEQDIYFRPDQNKLAELGLSWMAIKDTKPSDSVSRLLSEFLKELRE